MSYIGAEPTTAAFPFDQFSGNGTTTNFTLTYAPASVSSIIVSISGVVQNPNTYAVTGTTLNLTPAPPTGTNNIAVLYLGLPVIGVSSPGNTAYFSQSVFTATASQTVFTPSGTYQVGFLNVIRNGSTLAPADYTATNGTTVTLLNPCTAGDTVVIQVFNLVSIANALPATGGTVTGATTFNSTVSVNGANVSGFTGFKNRIINPGMVIDQRNNGASVTVNAPNSFYGVDRWFGYGQSADGVFTLQRITDAPSGFTNSMRATVTTADASIGASQLYFVQHRIEGFNVADFGFGTAVAAPVTLSFWVKSSVTGTFSGSLANNVDLSYAFSYTISSANTWTQVSVTVPGPTTGTWTTGNGIGLNVTFSLGVGSSQKGTANTWANYPYATTGSVDLISTLNATWQLTGVQLERGSNATSFEFRDYGRELILCQRYYEKSYDQGTTPGTVGSLGMFTSIRANGIAGISMTFKVTKRAAPTMTAYSPATGTAGNGRDYNAGAERAVTFDSIGDSAFTISMGGASVSSAYGVQWAASIEL